ncbi:hypothetical protein FCULG_00005650 [Fusarium culmorum]|uniref:Uncharacterized protein n=1 Tax=Fusarium culmorum TaxID=5516 RepID=A0A2T4GXZ3_FUSCU|nr:hypothetical protein FCULG_00005650 [Fusarium culmorum]
MSTTLYITLAYPSARFSQGYASNTITSPGDLPDSLPSLRRNQPLQASEVSKLESCHHSLLSDRVNSGLLSRATPKVVSDYYQNAQNRLFGQSGPSGPSCLRFLLAHAHESVLENVAKQGCTAVYGPQARPMGEETG